MDMTPSYIDTDNTVLFEVRQALGDVGEILESQVQVSISNVINNHVPLFSYSDSYMTILSKKSANSSIVHPFGTTTINYDNLWRQVQGCNGWKFVRVEA